MHGKLVMRCKGEELTIHMQTLQNQKCSQYTESIL